MKTIKSILKIAQCALLIAATCLTFGYAQEETTKGQDIKSMIEGQNFVFVAQTVSPMNGGIRQLTSYFDLKVAKDSLISGLPYFGRAYSPPINISEGPLSFTSTNFEYKVEEKKNGKWEVFIKPNEKNDIQQLLFTIFDNGDASLQVTSLTRQSISFHGYITGRGK